MENNKEKLIGILEENEKSCRHTQKKGGNLMVLQS